MLSSMDREWFLPNCCPNDMGDNPAGCPHKAPPCVGALQRPAEYPRAPGRPVLGGQSGKDRCPHLRRPAATGAQGCRCSSLGGGRSGAGRRGSRARLWGRPGAPGRRLCGLALRAAAGVRGRTRKLEVLRPHVKHRTARGGVHTHAGTGTRHWNGYQTDGRSTPSGQGTPACRTNDGRSCSKTHGAQRTKGCGRTPPSSGNRHLRREASGRYLGSSLGRSRPRTRLRKLWPRQHRKEAIKHQPTKMRSSFEHPSGRALEQPQRLSSLL